MEIEQFKTSIASIITYNFIRENTDIDDFEVALLAAYLLKNSDLI